MKGNTTLPWHKFEKIMIPNSLNSTIPEKLVDIIEVFVDDFIGATNNADLTHLLTSRAACCMAFTPFPPTLKSLNTEEVI